MLKARDVQKRLSVWRVYPAMLGISVLLLPMGCDRSSHQQDEQLKQQAAQATQQAKQTAKEAAADAKTVAANAERKVNDIAAGVQEGLHNGKPSAGSIDVNSASKARLMTLPGISAVRAQRILDNRPYSTPYDIVRKGVISKAEYDRIAGQVVAQ
jgi:DNA uptake protein ComE-like DNA-binding protein